MATPRPAFTVSIDAPQAERERAVEAFMRANKVERIPVVMPEFDHGEVPKVDPFGHARRGRPTGGSLGLDPAHVHALVQELGSMTAAAERLKTTVVTIGRTLERGGYSKPGSAGPKVTPEQAREAVDRAGSIAAAARALGVTDRTVGRALTREAP